MLYENELYVKISSLTVMKTKKPVTPWEQGISGFSTGRKK